MNQVNPKSIIEALLFSTHEPVSTRKLATILKDHDGREVRKIIEQLQKEYDDEGRGFTIREAAGGFQILSREEYSEYIRALHKSYAEARLSQAALETLAVIAYKQPVLRAEVEAIRGVQAGPLLRTLIERGLVKIVGRADTLGRPSLYGTTRRFLERFMLKSLKELPKIEVIETNPRESESPHELSPSESEASISETAEESSIENNIDEEASIQQS